jgi:hypothetical protein
MELIEKTLQRMSKNSLNIKSFSENPHSFLSKAHTKLFQINLIEERYRKNLQQYFLQTNKGIKSSELEIDFITLFIFMHIFLTELIQVIQVIPKEMKKNIGVEGFTQFFNDISRKDTFLKQFYIENRNELNTLEFEMSFYRDKFIEHNNRVSTDWKTVISHKREFYIEYVPKSPSTNEKITKIKDFLSSEFPDILGFEEDKDVIQFMRSIFGQIKDTALRDKVENLLKRNNYRSPNIYTVLIDLLKVTNAFLDELEKI